jgi:hypothetical protein
VRLGSSGSCGWWATKLGMFELVSPEAYRAASVEAFATFFFVFLHMALVGLAVSLGSNSSSSVVPSEIIIGVGTAILATVM